MGPLVTRREPPAAGDEKTSRCEIDTFVPLVGELFEIAAGSSILSVELVEVTDLREVQGAGQRVRQFSLVWRGPHDATLPQGIYHVTHPSIGPLELFLVCLGPDGQGMRYEAVFT